MKRAHGYQNQNQNQNSATTDPLMRAAPGGGREQSYYSGESLHQLPHQSYPAQQVYQPSYQPLYQPHPFHPPYLPHPVQQVNRPSSQPYRAQHPMPPVPASASELSQATRLPCEVIRTYTELTLSNSRATGGIYGKELINKILSESRLDEFSWKWKPAPVTIPDDASNRRYVCWTLHITENLPLNGLRPLIMSKLIKFIETFDSLFKYSNPSKDETSNAEIALSQPCTHSVSVLIPSKIWMTLTSSSHSETSHQIRKSVRNDLRLSNSEIELTPFQKQEKVKLEIQKRLVNASRYCYHFETALDALHSNAEFVSVYTHAVVKGPDVLFTFYHHDTQLLENFYDQLGVLTWLFNTKEDGVFFLNKYNKYRNFDDALKLLDPNAVKLPLEKGVRATLLNNDGGVSLNQYEPLLPQFIRKRFESLNQAASLSLAVSATRPVDRLAPPPYVREVAAAAVSSLPIAKPYQYGDFFPNVIPQSENEGDDEQIDTKTLEELLRLLNPSS